MYKFIGEAIHTETKEKR
nr:hypothetical protein [Bacillus subtilis]